MGLFQQDTAVRDENGKLSATLSRDWEIWGPNGGYVSAIALRAAGKIAPPDHRPATISVQYLSAGQFSDVEIEAEAMRKGRNAWCINVALVQNGKRFLQAQAWTTNKMEGPAKIDRRMPDVPHHSALKSWAELFPDDEESFPFWRNFDGKPARLMPEGTADPFLDFARAVLMIDTYPWIAFGRGLDQRPDYVAPTLDLTAWFHEPPGATEWLFTDARSDIARSGLIHGSVHVWSDHGRPVASGGSNLLHVARRG